MTRALVLSGGDGHPRTASEPALTDLLGPDTEVTTDIDRGLARLDPGHHDLLVVNALAFERSATHDRGRPSFRLDELGRARIEDWLAAGRPILALHTAVICFGEWPRWGAVLGGRWDWDRSWHPPIGPIEVDVGLAAVPDFAVYDECYCDLDLADDLRVLATVDGEVVAWSRTEGSARIGCCTLGHDERSLGASGHRRLLRWLIDWTLGRERCPD